MPRWAESNLNCTKFFKTLESFFCHLKVFYSSRCIQFSPDKKFSLSELFLCVIWYDSHQFSYLFLLTLTGEELCTEMGFLCSVDFGRWRYSLERIVSGIIRQPFQRRVFHWKKVILNFTGVIEVKNLWTFDWTFDWFSLFLIKFSL